MREASPWGELEGMMGTSVMGPSAVSTMREPAGSPCSTHDAGLQRILQSRQWVLSHSLYILDEMSPLAWDSAGSAPAQPPQGRCFAADVQQNVAGRRAPQARQPGTAPKADSRAGRCPHAAAARCPPSARRPPERHPAPGVPAAAAADAHQCMFTATSPVATSLVQASLQQSALMRL